MPDVAKALKDASSRRVGEALGRANLAARAIGAPQAPTFRLSAGKSTVTTDVTARVLADGLVQAVG